MQAIVDETTSKLSKEAYEAGRKVYKEVRSMTAKEIFDVIDYNSTFGPDGNPDWVSRNGLDYQDLKKRYNTPSKG